MTDLSKDAAPEREKVSCILCAYNESKRISPILTTLRDHPLLGEVIVVDDGSTDDTAEVVRGFPWVRLISYPNNLGKSNALAVGIAAAENEFITLLDADLIGLTGADVTALIEPVISGKADITISLRKNSLPIHKLLGLDFVSGERTFRKSFLADHVEAIAKLPGFGVEVYINELIIEQELRVRIVGLKNVESPRKALKVGFAKGNMQDARMIWDILKVISAPDIILQNYRMLSLSSNKEKAKRDILR
jgi:glycosyltransferase involved in cell wall biosynthesis